MSNYKWPENIVADRHWLSGSWVLYYLTDEQAKACAAAMNAPDARMQILAEALREARDNMIGWQGYASEYFKDKHDTAGDIAAIDAALAEAGIEQEKVK